MDRWGIPVLGLMALAALCCYCVLHEPQKIEEDLLTRSTAALQAGNIPIEGLSVWQQTAFLKGQRGSLIVSDDARHRVQGVWGVTDVIVQPTQQDAPPPPLILSPQASQLEVDLSTFVAGKNIRFAPASDIILPDGRAILDNIVMILANGGNIPVEISGYTDTDGDPKLNLDLSRRRATAVKRYLVSRGISAARLSDTGFGSAKPIASNDTPEGKARNRRIEFHPLKERSVAALSNE